jgi:hypothetical protein
MSIIENITCNESHCVSLYVPMIKPLGDVLKHLDSEIDNLLSIEHSDAVTIEILRTVRHLVNVYKSDDQSLIIFINENVVCILTDSKNCPVKTYGLYIDTKFYMQPDIGDTNGDNED